MTSSRTICFLLLPNVHLMDLAGPAQVFYEASQFGPEKYNITYCAVDPEVTSEQGLLFASLPSFNTVQLKPKDFLFVPGIDFKTFTEGKLSRAVTAVAPWLHEQYANGVHIGSVCSGSLILAEAGLMDGKKCTTHWKCIDYMQKRYPRISVQIDQLYVHDRNIYTSAGMTSGIDMALSILEQHHGPMLPAKVAREIVVYLRRNNEDSQQTIYLDYRTHFNPTVHKVQDYIISHPNKNPGLDDLAAIGNTSVRNLTRMFKKSTGHTIIQFKNAVKVEMASKLVHNSEYTLEKVASMCGFENARHLRRVWEEYRGGVLRRKVGVS